MKSLRWSVLLGMAALAVAGPRPAQADGAYAGISLFYGEEYAAVWRLPTETHGFQAYEIIPAKNPRQTLALLFVIDQAKIRAQFVDLPLAGTGKKVSPKLERHRLKRTGQTEDALLAINGGYFTQDFQPDGLFRTGGREIAPLTSKAVHSGAVVVEQGRIELIARAEIAQQREIMQSGPFLIDPGGELGIQRDGPKTERTVLALTGPGPGGGPPLLLVAVFKRPLSLVQAATLLHQLPVEEDGRPGLPSSIERALNLDGGPSTGFWCSALPDRSFEPGTPVRNLIVWTRR